MFRRQAHFGYTLRRCTNWKCAWKELDFAL